MSTDIHSLFVFILALFTFASTFLSAYSVSNAVRLRSVRMSWRAGKMSGYPLFSSLFVISIATLTIAMFQKGAGQYIGIMACYGWIGLNWFVSSYLASKHFITDHGIVKNINDPSQTVAWYQITDYLEKTSGENSSFLFMYQNPGTDGRKATGLIRLEITVPKVKLLEFRKIVSLKLGKQLHTDEEVSIDLKAHR